MRIELTGETTLDEIGFDPKKDQEEQDTYHAAQSFWDSHGTGAVNDELKKSIWGELRRYRDSLSSSFPDAYRPPSYYLAEIGSDMQWSFRQDIILGFRPGVWCRSCVLAERGRLASISPQRKFIVLQSMELSYSSERRMMEDPNYCYFSGTLDTFPAWGTPTVDERIVNHSHLQTIVQTGPDIYSLGVIRKAENIDDRVGTSVRVKNLNPEWLSVQAARTPIFPEALANSSNHFISGVAPECSTCLTPLTQARHRPDPRQEYDSWYTWQRLSLATRVLDRYNRIEESYSFTFGRGFNSYLFSLGRLLGSEIYLTQLMKENCNWKGRPDDL